LLLKKRTFREFAGVFEDVVRACSVEQNGDIHCDSDAVSIGCYTQTDRGGLTEYNSPNQILSKVLDMTDPTKVKYVPFEYRFAVNRDKILVSLRSPVSVRHTDDDLIFGMCALIWDEKRAIEKVNCRKRCCFETKLSFITLRDD
jgi:hypothetical protein